MCMVKALKSLISSNSIITVIVLLIVSLNVNAMEFKSIRVSEPLFYDGSSYASIYTNEDMVFAKIHYSVSQTHMKQVVYNLTSGELVFSEGYDLYKEKSNGLYKDIIRKYGLTKLEPLNLKYDKSKGWYFNTQRLILSHHLSGRCSTPFDSHFKVLDKPFGLINKSIVIIESGDLVHSSRSECDNMNGKSFVNIKSRSLGIRDVWLLDNSLYIVALMHSTELLYFNNKFEPINLPDNFVLVEKEKLSKFISTFDNNYDFNNGESQFGAVSEAVIKEFMINKEGK